MLRLIIAILLVAQIESAAAEEIARCGPSEGSSFYAASETMARDNFSTDRADGELVLTKEDGAYDLSLGDSGRTVRKNGGELHVFPLGASIMAIAMWAGDIETYIFTLEKGKPILMWTRNRVNGAKSAGAYVAACKFAKLERE